MRKLRLPPALVSEVVPVAFTAEEIIGLNFMASSVGLDRASMIKRALNVVAVLGLDFADTDCVEGALTEVRCGICGARW